jgi:putative transposase
MKELLFGGTSFSRGDVPDSLRQLESWPTVDHMAMSEEVREDFKSRCEAIRLFLDETTMPVSSITAVTGIQRGTLYRLLKRCWTKHTDGQIYGFRGAIPYARFKAYTRTAPVPAARARLGGAAGAFEQLLSQYPRVAQLLMKHAKKRDKKIQGPAVFKKSMLEIHQQFLQLCREEGIDPTHYPFSESRLAFRSIQRFFKRMADVTVLNNDRLDEGAEPPTDHSGMTRSWHHVGQFAGKAFGGVIPELAAIFAESQ